MYSVVSHALYDFQLYANFKILLCIGDHPHVCINIQNLSGLSSSSSSGACIGVEIGAYHQGLLTSKLPISSQF